MSESQPPNTEAMTQIDDAESDGVSFNAEQFELIASLELIFYGESSIAEELDREGMVRDETTS